MLLGVSLFCAALNAQETDSSNAQLVAERPNASGTITEVTYGVFLIDIDEIDDVRQRFNVDMFVNIAWQDTRLALPENERSDQIRRFPMSEIWTPRGLIVNDRGLEAQLPLVVDVDARSTWTSKISRSTLSTCLSMSFPISTVRMNFDFHEIQP
jgi:hypothetical protein